MAHRVCPHLQALRPLLTPCHAEPPPWARVCPGPGPFAAPQSRRPRAGARPLCGPGRPLAPLAGLPGPSPGRAQGPAPPGQARGQRPFVGSGVAPSAREPATRAVLRGRERAARARATPAPPPPQRPRWPSLGREASRAGRVCPRGRDGHAWPPASRGRGPQAEGTAPVSAPVALRSPVRPREGRPEIGGALRGGAVARPRCRYRRGGRGAPQAMAAWAA